MQAVVDRRQYHGSPMSAQAGPTLRFADQPLKGIALICLAVWLFACHDALSKYLAGFYPVVMVVWARYLSHTLLMMGIFIPRSGMAVIRTKRPGLQVLRALCLIGCSLLFTTALHYLPMAEATAVNFLAPLMVTALSVPLLKETVSRSQWAAVLAGFVGVLVIVRPGGQLFTPAVLLPVCSAVCFGLYQLLTRILSATDSPTTSNFLTGVVNTLVLSALVPFFWEVPTLGHGFMLALLGFFGMTAHLLLTQAFRYAPPALLAPFSYGQIVTAGIVGYFAFGHVPDGGAMIGILIICASGLAVAWQQSRKRPKAKPVPAPQSEALPEVAADAGELKAQRSP
ncbi:drug/metabolite transporter (DMT)-like permease [Pseudomonas psychrotolerans]|uniref:Drug/metabolite transporter (DMT)-like permease n=2 Tax=Pseudomonas oryzihabitans TaxID=47885 RepID=A0AAJ2BHG7_9PSED|nr:drug/metabolite transporter (DMT)-like permease [Pseudomonas psychrotolerans]